MSKGMLSLQYLLETLRHKIKKPLCAVDDNHDLSSRIFFSNIGLTTGKGFNKASLNPFLSLFLARR